MAENTKPSPEEKIAALEAQVAEQAQIIKDLQAKHSEAIKVVTPGTKSVTAHGEFKYEDTTYIITAKAVIIKGQGQKSAEEIAKSKDLQKLLIEAESAIIRKK